MTDQEIQQACAKFIEGFEGCRLKAYQDQGGRWTIGYGSTGPGIGPGIEWSQQQADERLQSDLQDKFIPGVRSLVKVPLSDNQFIALVDFAYNLGLHNLQRSGLLKLINLSKYKDAADQFLLWNRIGSYVSPGLNNRRIAERSLFLKP